MKLDLTIKELCEILETEAIGVSKRILNRKVNLCLDSRNIEKGSVFFALSGVNFDAHQFVGEAISRGALMGIVNKEKVQENNFIAYAPVEDTTKALLQLAKGYQKRFQLKKVAITGSNGKTTTKEMVRCVLEKKFKTLATNGNYNNHIGVPLTLFRLKHSDEVAVIEMGTSGKNEIHPLSMATEPHIAVITNIGASHLENLGSLEGVFKEKLSITDGFKNKGLLIVNADDAYLGKLRNTKRYDLLTFGIRRGIIKPENLSFDENACASFKLGRFKIHLNVPGVHNVYNALAAFAVGISLKVPKTEIVQALNEFQATGMRMEIKNGNGFKIISDCYNANPNSTRMALQTLGNFKKSNSKILVLGDMLELGENSKQLHQDIGALIPEYDFDFLLTIGNQAKEIGIAAQKKGMNKNKIRHFENCNDLIVFLESIVSLDDIILVKGSRGMHLERVVDALTKMPLAGV